MKKVTKDLFKSVSNKCEGKYYQLKHNWVGSHTEIQTLAEVYYISGRSIAIHTHWPNEDIYEVDEEFYERQIS